MTITKVVKVSNRVVVTEDGVEASYTITGEHVVVSHPPTGYKKILNIYYNDIDDQLIIVHEE